MAEEFEPVVTEDDLHRVTLARMALLTPQERTKWFLWMVEGRDTFGRKVEVLQRQLKRSEKWNQALADSVKRLSEQQVQILEVLELLQAQNQVLQKELRFARNWADGQHTR